MKWEPVQLAAHGTEIRARVCTDDCPECAPKRAAKRLYNRHMRHVQQRRDRKLTEADFEAIDRLRGRGFSVPSIAQAYGVKGDVLAGWLRRRDEKGGRDARTES